MQKVFTYTGDGIGPEITAPLINIFKAAEVPIEFVIDPTIVMGERALSQGLEVLPQSAINAFKQHGIMLKAPLNTPTGKGFKSINVQTRNLFELDANIRPVKSIPGVDIPVRVNKNIHFIYERDSIEQYNETSYYSEAVDDNHTADGNSLSVSFQMIKQRFKDALDKAVTTARENREYHKIVLTCIGYS
jgi:isocitrate dehydrogenase (NAD+)